MAMSVLKAWLGVALALAEFAVLPHCEGKVKTAAGVCVPSCSLKHAAAFRVLWVGWKFSDLGREVDMEWVFLLKSPLLVSLEVKSQPATASSLLFGGGWGSS